MSLKVDGAILTDRVADSGDAARRLEALGYDGAFSFEGPHDPFFPLVLAAGRTERIELATGIAVAFARNPMILANIGYDLQELSAGRFILGLGSQIRPHIEKRFSSTWSRPAARMGEIVLAIRAIWRSWQERVKLDFRGEFYTHTLMVPFFDPGPNPYGTPPIFVAGVGPGMTRVAGQVADGFFVHPFHSERSLAEITLPALENGLALAGRSFADFSIACQVLVVTGWSDEELEAARQAVGSQLAFYGSTPAYRPVLESHGWGELQSQLNGLSKRGRWAEMAALIDDEMLETLAVCGPPGEIATRIHERCGGFASRVSLVAPYLPDPERWGEIVGTLQKIP